MISMWINAKVENKEYNPGVGVSSQWADEPQTRASYMLMLMETPPPPSPKRGFTTLLLVEPKV
jgi:hypothetical protein